MYTLFNNSLIIYYKLSKVNSKLRFQQKKYLSVINADNINIKITEIDIMYLIVFCIGGVAYNLLEYLWRGYSHWTMTIDGGLCLMGIYALCTITDMNYIYKVISSALLITGIEFLSGLIVNRVFHMGVWDYSHMPYNIMGQICPGYTLLWTALCVPLVAVITLIGNG